MEEAAIEIRAGEKVTGAEIERAEGEAKVWAETEIR